MIFSDGGGGLVDNKELISSKINFCVLYYYYMEELLFFPINNLLEFLLKNFFFEKITVYKKSLLTSFQYQNMSPPRSINSILSSFHYLSTKYESHGVNVLIKNGKKYIEHTYENFICIKLMF